MLVDGGVVPDAPGCLRPLFRLPGLSDFVFEQMHRQAYSHNGLKRMIHNEALLSADRIAHSQKASYGFVTAMRQMATTTSPTLVVWGEHDRLSSPQAGRALAESIPGARFHLIKNAGHLPQLEQPGAFNDLVLKFLASP